MSEWKVGDKAYVPVTIDNESPGDLLCITNSGVDLVLVRTDVVRSIPPSQPAPVDVAAIRVGDEVTVKGKVIGFDDDEILIDFKPTDEGWSVWVPCGSVISHTPAPRPTTLAEFDALPMKVRERLFAEMAKSKRVE